MSVYINQVMRILQNSDNKSKTMCELLGLSEDAMNDALKEFVNFYEDPTDHYFITYNFISKVSARWCTANLVTDMGPFDWLIFEKDRGNDYAIIAYKIIDLYDYDMLRANGFSGPTEEDCMKFRPSGEPVE